MDSEQKRILLKFETTYQKGGLEALQKKMLQLRLDTARSVQAQDKILLSSVMQQKRAFERQQESIKKQNETLRKQNEAFSDATGYSGRFAKQLNAIQAASKKLLMPMLGVMFFGMAMRSMFIQLFNPVMEAFGVFDLFQAMLLVLFLPVMEMIFPYLLKFAEFFMNLPEPVQKVIGILAIVGIVLGTILTVGGAIAIAVMAMVAALTALGTTATAAGAFLSAMFAPFIAILAAAILAWIVFRQAFEENFLGIQTFVQMIWDGISNIFSGAIQIIKGLWSILVGLFTGDLTKIKEGFFSIFSGIWNMLKGFVQLVIGLFATLGLTLLKFIMNIGSIGAQMARALVDGIKSGWSWLKDAFLGWIPSLSAVKNYILSKFGIGRGSKDSGSSSKSTSSPKKFNDMIWRPGSDPVSISPQDTLVATKGGPAGGGSSQVINATYNVSVSDKAEFQRMLDENNRRLMDDLRRITRA
jgi:hypothetical protein